MAANPYVLNADVTITWDGVSVRLMRGTVIDTPASSGSNLAATIGSSNLTALPSQVTSDMGGISSAADRMANKTGGGQMPYSWGQVG